MISMVKTTIAIIKFLFLPGGSRPCFYLFTLGNMPFSCMLVEFPIAVRTLDVVWVLCRWWWFITCSLGISDGFDEVFMLSSPIHLFGLRKSSEFSFSFWLGFHSMWDNTLSPGRFTLSLPEIFLFLFFFRSNLSYGWILTWNWQALFIYDSELKSLNIFCWLGWKDCSFYQE